MIHLVARAPVRICDCGGWTDTWFARHGRVCHIAVWPGIEVDLLARSRAGGRAQLSIASGGGPPDIYTEVGPPWGAHPIVEASLAQLPPPADLDVTLTVRSPIPAGAATGTSAAVSVAVIAAVSALHGRRVSPREVAALAHDVEVVRLGQESGIQDQLAAAYGGINDIRIDAYPDARVIQIRATDAAVRALEDRLLLVYLGRAHDSSSVHRTVIDRLTRNASEDAALEALRHAAAEAASAIRAGDFAALGRAMQANTRAQRALHPALVGAEAEDVIAAARAAGAIGWKVNGAGGDGGSLTVLCSDRRDRDALSQTLEWSGRGWLVIPVRIARSGVNVSAR